MRETDFIHKTGSFVDFRNGREKISMGRVICKNLASIRQPIDKLGVECANNWVTDHIVKCAKNLLRSHTRESVSIEVNCISDLLRKKWGTRNIVWKVQTKVTNVGSIRTKRVENGRWFYMCIYKSTLWKSSVFREKKTREWDDANGRIFRRFLWKSTKKTQILHISWSQRKRWEKWETKTQHVCNGESIEKS